MSPFTSHPDDLISASLTGDLSPLERRELDRHLTACPECRATLDAFREQRHLLSAMTQASVPRDLGARVRSGIQSGRFGAPWWRRPGGLLAAAASVGTVAAAGLLALFVLNIGRGQPPVAASFSASPSAVSSLKATPASTPSPSPEPLPLGAQPGDLLYTRVSGAFDKLKLDVVNQANSKSIAPQNPDEISWDSVRRASLSPDGKLLAFAVDTGQKGTLRIFVTDLSTGATSFVAESFPAQFGRRLLWSPDGRYLAFTVQPEGTGITDVWLYDRRTDSAQQVTKKGNAYAASWGPLADGQETLWISLGAADPTSVAAAFPADGGSPGADLTDHPSTKADGVFMPLLSPDGDRAIFWQGTMNSANEQGWIFSKGGMPMQTTSAGGGVPNWNSGTKLFADLESGPSGQAFASGEVTWAQDSDAFAFWAGLWTSQSEAPSSTTYPDENGVYAGRASAGPLTKDSALQLGKTIATDGNQMFVVDVALSPDGGAAAITLGIPRAGDLSPPASLLRLSALAGGDVKNIDGASPQPWLGPGVYVP